MESEKAEVQPMYGLTWAAPFGSFTDRISTPQRTSSNISNSAGSDSRFQRVVDGSALSTNDPVLSNENRPSSIRTESSGVMPLSRPKSSSVIAAKTPSSLEFPSLAEEAAADNATKPFPASSIRVNREQPQLSGSARAGLLSPESPWIPELGKEPIDVPHASVCSVLAVSDP